MWAADDDFWDPRYIGACVAALDASPNAVLACSALRFIDEAGKLIDLDYSIYDNPDLSSRSLNKRLERYLGRGGWYQSYGLIRASALRKTSGFQNVFGPDVLLVLELMLQGPFVKVSDPLYFYRQHQSRTDADRAERQGLVEDASALRFGCLQLQSCLIAAIDRAPAPWLTRKALLARALWITVVSDPIWRLRLQPELPGMIRMSVGKRDWLAVARYGFFEFLGRVVALARRAGRRLRPAS
jgi:hypothetical protein